MASPCVGGGLEKGHKIVISISKMSPDDQKMTKWKVVRVSE